MFLGGTGIKMRSLDLKPLPNLDWALRGYNILEGNPLFTDTDGDEGFKSPIFQETYDGGISRLLVRESGDAQRFKEPRGIDIYSEDICTISFDAVSISNEKKYRDDLSTKANADLNLGALVPFKFTSNAEYQKKTERMTSKKSIFVKSSNECVKYEIVVNLYNPPEFTTGFKNAVIGLNNDSNSEDFNKFINNFGTHFLKTTHMGARYGKEAEITKTTREKLDQEGFDFNLAMGLHFKIKLGMEVNVTKKKEVEETFSKYGIHTKTIKAGTPIPKKGEVREWANRVIQNPFPISYELQPIENLFDEHFMKDLKVDYKKIKKALIDFKNEYCSTHKCIQPIMGCGGGDGCPTNMECEESLNERYDPEYSCKCNRPFVQVEGQCSGWNDQSPLKHDRYIGIRPAPDENPKWYPWDMCPENTYAYSFALKVEADVGVYDDSGLNGVKLYCKMRGREHQEGSASSSQGSDGTWTNKAVCTEDGKMLTGYQFKSETDPGGFGPWKDYKYGQMINVKCEDGEKIFGERLGIKPDSGGKWSSWTSCTTGYAICGIRTKRVPGDESYGLLDLEFMCCKF